MNRTTKIIRQGGEYFVAETEDCRLRIGLLNTVALDVPYRHEEILAVAAIENTVDFDAAAESLFDDLYCHRA